MASQARCGRGTGVLRAVNNLTDANGESAIQSEDVRHSHKMDYGTKNAKEWPKTGSDLQRSARYDFNLVIETTAGYQGSQFTHNVAEVVVFHS